MSANPFASAAARGWHIVDASRLDRDLTLEADVAIVGTGAGGATAADVLSAQGLRVVMLEEGPLRTSRDFHMLEREAYPQLYQESAGRRTKDKGITILQGRSVGGSTTVNWTASFRTPATTLAYWRSAYGLQQYTPETLAPWFARMEQRLSIAPWALPPNENNAVLRRGAAAVGVATGVVPRNVKACRNLGYCGLGCPVDAKQSMLVTTIPAALERGATLISRVRADRFAHAGGVVTMLECSALDASGLRPGAHRVRVTAHTFVCAAGAIGSPALLLRSGVPDPNRVLGKRTFLHPTLVSAADMPETVDAFAGAPQSVYSDHYLQMPLDGPIGFKLEVPPVHPVLMATTLPGFGTVHAGMTAQMRHTQVQIALLRDGFHPESPGGSVSLRGDGSPVLDYPITAYLWEGARRALHAMAEIQFAAGARTVFPLHESARQYGSLREARDAIDALPMEILRTRVVSAHVMGGCGMSGDPAAGVVDPFGRHHQMSNLYVFDGSVFPTSLGTNPQLSIYGITARNASRLADLLNAGC
ncbi:MAG TPA: GMC family oxidoreductase [Candidatus Dormibacteraeota bacterium]|nr:GMC family oxidoreductase [Candidatus Dormibacteraeota bacterium]